MFALSLEGIRPRQPLSRPALPTSTPSLFSLFATKRTKLTSLFSYSSALFKKECLPKPFAINLFRTLSQNTRGGRPPFPSPLNFELPALSGVEGSTRLFSSLDALDLDAASSISPLFATLTKNTGGWGAPFQRAESLFPRPPQITGHGSRTTSHHPLLTTHSQLTAPPYSRKDSDSPPP
jgi:hypothetical protein